MATPKKGPSVTKILINLVKSDPSNRSCADCRSALVDPSDVYASLCPSLHEIVTRDDERSRIAVAFHDFKQTHRAFAPPAVKRMERENHGVDPAIIINQRFGGHGLFVCTKCAEAHRTLGDTVTRVLAVQDSASWTEDEALFMTRTGGNAKARLLYEAFLPETWKNKRPNQASSLEDRVIFCKAKYEALAFAMPLPGPLSHLAWMNILRKNETGKRFNSAGLQNIQSLSPAVAAIPSENEPGRSGSGGHLPDRLMDFFCVVSNAGHLHPSQLDKDLSTLSSPEQLQLWPQVSDCYPPQEAHDDMLFPGHLPSFVLPSGCCPSKTQKAPTFYTFVLTLGDGDRVYGGALQIYDEHIESDQLRDLILSSGYEGTLPKWMEVETDILFLPKCLVLLSHYPFFDIFRESLLQLYRITLVESPLPIERYIAYLVSEVPLPPQGKIRVEVSFTPRSLIRIERPPPNRLPLANFSYRPLFASLSVGNIMVVFGCLLEESKVALLSSNCSILTPVAESLLSALFPFEWQGLYIPLMPYSMLDILDAPVPFIVGLDSRYLHETPPHRRPKGVVLVDLDRDVVHLGVDDMTGENRQIPPLPPKSAMKLKTSLEDHGGSMYLLPNSGIKGCIMEGHDQLLLVRNNVRPKYAKMQSVTLDADSLRRENIHKRTKKAYDEIDQAEGIPSFRTLHGIMQEQDDHDSDSSGHCKGDKPSRKRRKPKFMRDTGTEILTGSTKAGEQAHLLDMNDPEGFSSTGIRSSFLRFMVATFANYAKFITEGKRTVMFDENRFLRDLAEDKEVTVHLGRVLTTQMFQRFLEERMENPGQTEIRFFDEAIVAKLNRSKVKKMAKGGKIPTPFLDDDSGKITKTYSHPPPSNLGLPDSNQVYQYNQFPSLDLSLIGHVRPQMLWSEKQNQLKRMRSTRNLNVRQTQQDILRKAMAPFLAPAALAALARRSARDLDTALTALRGIQWEKRLKYMTTPKREIDRILRRVGTAESTESENTVKTLSKAETIMINARRKQSILLDLVIMLQAHWRSYVGRKRYNLLKKAVVSLQRRFRKTYGIRTSQNDEPERILQSASIITIQSTFRRFHAQKVVLRRRKAAVSIQRAVAGFCMKRRFVRKRAGAVLIQKHIRERRDRILFGVTLLLISKLQARMRGYMVRRKVGLMLQQAMVLYRKEIVSLWQESHVPLSLRTNFWNQLVSKETFARLRVAENELRRMWRTLGIELDGKGLSVSDTTTSLANSLGIDMKNYHICHELSFFTKHNTPFESLLPALAEAYGFEQAERLQIYERLNSKSIEIDHEGLYREFGIAHGDKKKKVALARAVWSSNRLADVSRKTMLKLFPELGSSLNVSFQPACSKSKKRFPDANKVPSYPVTMKLWDEISLDGLIRKHTKEVTHLYITQVPTLMARFDTCDCRRDANLKSWRIVFRENEVEMIRKYLHKPAATTELMDLRPQSSPREVESSTGLVAGGISPFPDILSSRTHEFDSPKSTRDSNIAAKEMVEGQNVVNQISFPDILLQVPSEDNPVNCATFPSLEMESSADEHLNGASFPDIILSDPIDRANGKGHHQIPAN